MARRRRKKTSKNIKKWLAAIHPATFFIKQRRLRWGRVIIMIILVTGFAVRFTDLGHQVQQQNMTPVDQLPLNKLTYGQFIERLAPQAQKLQTQYGVRASISLAQAALESNWGRSELAYKYNNFYGVKASQGMPSVILPTKEFIDGKWVTIDGPFRKYTDWQESMTDHALVLVNGTSENHARYQGVFTATNPEAAAKALVAGGYATDPQYAEKIINLIHEYKLTQYDQ
ncbi:MAG: glycoside hydrolase family 73 protein [Lactobacillaceae bacterium]|jgi:flagellum-specific peptidoglycan hydrolase FlgJ|nr:glycoside hydrolase family 73 protein [Lactobacillaceae bacterium]